MLTPEQHAARKEGIGGSDCAAICGFSKWKTPLDVYLEKIGESTEKEENRFTYFGNVLEPVIRKEYEKRTNTIVGCPTTTSLSLFHPWMIANVDGYVDHFGAGIPAIKPIIVEFKTASERTLDQWGEEGTDQIPNEYLFQCAHYAIICDAERVDLAVLIGGNDFRIYSYNRNDLLEKKIIKLEERFWNENVLAKVPPEPMTKEDLRKLWPDSIGKQAIADNNILEKAYDLSRIKKKISELEKEEEDIKYEIQKFMKDSDVLVDSNIKQLLTYKTQNYNRLDIERLKKDKPEIYNKFLKKSSSRVFRLNKIEV